MLKYITETYRVDPARYADLRDSVLEYVACMVQDGFIGLRHDFLIEEPISGTLQIGGVLTYPIYPMNPNEFEGIVAERCNRLAEKRRQVEKCSLEVTVQFANKFGSSDRCYCEHDDLSGIVLASDWPQLVSPVSCRECGGYVARCLLPITDAHAGDIWTWDVQTQFVEGAWSFSGELEQWADGERHHPGSRLNQLGLSIVQKMKAESAVDGWVYIPSRESVTGAICPVCDDEMVAVKTTSQWNRACPACRTVGIDVGDLRAIRG